MTGCGGDSGPTPGSLAITTTSLPDGTVNQAYSASLSGSGGALPTRGPSRRRFLPISRWIRRPAQSLAHRLRRQPRPTRLRSRQLGSFPNRPTNAQHNDPAGSGRADNYHHFTPDGTVSQAYSRPVQASGGTPPLTWNIVAGTGTLPPGLNLNQTTGAISGTPTAAGTSSFTVRVQDHEDNRTRKRCRSRSTRPPPDRTRRISRPPRSRQEQSVNLIASPCR